MIGRDFILQVVSQYSYYYEQNVMKPGLQKSPCFFKFVVITHSSYANKTKFPSHMQESMHGESYRMQIASYSYLILKKKNKHLLQFTTGSYW